MDPVVPLSLYSSECVEGGFLELRPNGVLRNSLPSHNAYATTKLAHLGDTLPPTEAYDAIIA